MIFGVSQATGRSCVTVWATFEAQGPSALRGCEDHVDTNESSQMDELAPYHV
jgi:hypothetical protein